jgi:hypothetical protein
MKTSLFLLALSAQAFAHRLDEYLQATLISLGKDGIEVDMRLTPGVAVAPFVLATIDRNGDGVISSEEQSAYVDQVLCDVSITLDGDPLPLRAARQIFPGIQDMREGRGEIQMEFVADTPRANVASRSLVIDNKHQSRIAAYLVNAVAPSDPDIRITAQSRNYQQSSYRLDYSQASTPTSPLSLASWSGQRVWLLALSLLMTTRLTVLWRRRRA